MLQSARLHEVRPTWGTVLHKSFIERNVALGVGSSIMSLLESADSRRFFGPIGYGNRNHLTDHQIQRAVLWCDDSHYSTSRRPFSEANLTDDGSMATVDELVDFSKTLIGLHEDIPEIDAILLQIMQPGARTREHKDSRTNRTITCGSAGIHVSGRQAFFMSPGDMTETQSWHSHLAANVGTEPRPTLILVGRS